MTTNTDYLQVIKESFDPKLIVALYKNFSDQYVALQELIDNSVDDMIEGKKLIVNIDIDDKIIIKNHNGKGMNIDDLLRFFTWGASDKRKRIGRYGQGGKAALGYLAKSFCIKSHPLNSEDGYFVKVEDWENREEGFKEFNIESYNSSHSKDTGTVTFEISNLNKKFRIETLADKIENIYRPLILNENVEFILNGEPIKCIPAKYDDGTNSNFSINIDVNGLFHKIYGEYGIVSDKNAPRGGFNIYQFGRRVAQKEYFGHTDPSKRWNVERIYGELNIDFEIPLLMNKTDIDRDSIIWKTIFSKMHLEIDPTVRQAKDYKEPSKKEEKSVNKISEKVVKKEGKQNIKMSLTNYGPNLLFKLDSDKHGVITIKINREHKAYKKWCTTAKGKDLYLVMLYSLYSASINMSKKEASKFLQTFSESLKEHTDKLL